jgi:hypothetical protein
MTFFKRSRPFQIAFLTLIFGGLYFAIRAMPASECGFLHYEVTEVTDDGIELCATSHPGFIDLTRMRFPIDVRIHSNGPIVVGEENELEIEIFGPRGRALFPHDLAITHTERIHLMMIDPEMGDYHHLHPRADGFSSRYTVRWTPVREGTYRFFAEMVPLEIRRQVVGHGTVEVVASPGVEIDRQKTPDWLKATFSYGNPRARRDLPVSVTLERTDGRLLQLEMIMGDFAHMVGFDRQQRGYTHMHTIPTGREEASPAELQFLFHASDPGHYRFWLQVMIDGREVFVPYDLELR